MAKKLRTALLMTEGSPVGLRYLEAMLKNGMPPTLVVESNTQKLSKMAIDTVRERTKGRFTWKPLSELKKLAKFEYALVDDHNSEQTRDLMRQYEIDIAILGGTKIIKRETIEVPRIGMINTHPGILPDYRGNNAVEWSLYNDDPIGASCHFVVEDIDAGAIIAIRKAEIERGDDYETVRFKAYTLQVDVLIDALKKLEKDDFRSSLMPNEGGKYYLRIGEAELKKAIDRLSDGSFSHFSS